MGSVSKVQGISSDVSSGIVAKVPRGDTKIVRKILKRIAKGENRWEVETPEGS